MEMTLGAIYNIRLMLQKVASETFDAKRHILLTQVQKLIILRRLITLNRRSEYF